VGAISIGVDIGQRVDPTAVAVVEKEGRTRPVPDKVIEVGGIQLVEKQYPKTDDHFLVRHLERLPLGTPYPKVAERLCAIAGAVRARAHEYPDLYVDATGVGTPIVDLLEAAGVTATLYATYFTHGDRRTASGHEIKLGKAWLVSRLQALLQTGCLHLPRTAEAEALARELLDYEIHVDANANDTYGAFKVGTHDDLVTALGLAVQGPVGHYIVAY
jgi:hypothetical protein